MGLLGIFSKKRAGEGPRQAFSLSEASFQEMLFFSEDRELRRRLPNLEGQRVLEVSPRGRSLAPLLQEKGARIVTSVGGLREKEGLPPSGIPFILSHWEHLPFLDSSWEFVLLRVAFLKVGVGRLLREAVRVLRPGGGLLMSDLHPFSSRVQREHRASPVEEEGVGPGFERYWKLFHEVGLGLQSVRELYFEGSLRKFFVSDGEMKEFEGLRRTPFLILFLLRKEG